MLLKSDILNMGFIDAPVLNAVDLISGKGAKLKSMSPSWGDFP
jgi:hypothetical protein